MKRTNNKHKYKNRQIKNMSFRPKTKTCFSKHLCFETCMSKTIGFGVVCFGNCFRTQTNHFWLKKCVCDKHVGQANVRLFLTGPIACKENKISQKESRKTPQGFPKSHKRSRKDSEIPHKRIPDTPSRPYCHKSRVDHHFSSTTFCKIFQKKIHRFPSTLQ